MKVSFAYISGSFVFELRICFHPFVIHVILFANTFIYSFNLKKCFIFIYYIKHRVDVSGGGLLALVGVVR